MTCPNDQVLIDGQADEHLAACLPCRARARSLARVIDALGAIEATPDPAFAQRVLRRLDRPRKPRLLQAALAAAAICALFAFSRSTPQLVARGPTPSPSATISSRTVGFVVYRRDTLLRAGDRFGEDDGLSFRIFNRSNQDVELLLFGVDHRGDVHWLEPEFSETARSRTVSREATAFDLPYGVYLENSAPGPFALVAMFSPAALSVADVEKILAGEGLDALQAHFPEAIIDRLDTELR